MNKTEEVDVVYNPRSHRFLKKGYDSDDEWVLHPADATHFFSDVILMELTLYPRTYAMRVKLITSYEVVNVSSEKIVKEYRGR